MRRRQKHVYRAQSQDSTHTGFQLSSLFFLITRWLSGPIVSFTQHLLITLFFVVIVINHHMGTPAWSCSCSSVKQDMYTTPFKREPNDLKRKPFKYVVPSKKNEMLFTLFLESMLSRTKTTHLIINNNSNHSYKKETEPLTYHNWNPPSDRTRKRNPRLSNTTVFPHTNCNNWQMWNHQPNKCLQGRRVCFVLLRDPNARQMPVWAPPQSGPEIEHSGVTWPGDSSSWPCQRLLVWF